MFEKRVLEVLEEYEKRATAEALPSAIVAAEQDPARPRWEDFDEFLLAVGRETGVLLHLLAVQMNAKTLVDIGTSYGYSTLWLAAAARATGGKVHSFEISAPKVAHARSSLERAGLAEYVQFHVGDVLEMLPRASGNFDLVLIDAWKDLYVPCFELVYPRLSPAGLVVADNMLRPELSRTAAEAYQAHVRTRAVDSILLDVGQGLELTRKR